MEFTLTDRQVEMLSDIVEALGNVGMANLPSDIDKGDLYQSWENIRYEIAVWRAGQ